jgi:hypothetical protein
VGAKADHAVGEVVRIGKGIEGHVGSMRALVGPSHFYAPRFAAIMSRFRRANSS